ncbi:MAG: beta-N-acetylhexosaminidase [Gammaproteobacteria bacterium]|jgi:beta-N-acetylhexosaminidase|nr:beta-N-acetylhexosaminidase [Gammaproteobacteria bacterium]
MSLGPVMVDLEGTVLSGPEESLLRHPMVGGVILFTRNFESIPQLRVLVASIHALRHPRLLVAVDHEGGRVQRFREGFTCLPPARSIGDLYASDPGHARSSARLLGWLMAAELRAVGIDFSFTPVLDLGHGLGDVIGDRAYHRGPEVVADLAHHTMVGMRDAGMAAVGKHFPGHGSVKEDSHIAMPVDRRPLADVMGSDVLPFERMIHYGLAGMMPAHVIYPSADPRPAGFSPFWLQGVLRGQLGFQGAIFSDDLSMEAAHVAGDLPARARKALEAGCDMVLVCNHPQGARETVESLEGYESPASLVRLARMHAHGGDGEVTGPEGARWREAVALAASLKDSPGYELNV